MSENKSIMPTSCEKCIFKIEKDGKQVGCEFNRIEKFKQNRTVEEVTVNNKSFYVIDAFCNRCRNSEWANKNLNKDLKELVIKESNITCDLILYMGNGSNVELLQNSINYIQEMEVKPCQVIVLHNEENIKSLDILKLLRPITTFKWRYEKIWEKTQDDRLIKIERALDIVFKHCEGIVFTVFAVGAYIEKDFFDRINFLLNNEMERFVLIKPDHEDNGAVFLSYLYKILNGNANKNFFHKVEIIAKEENNTHLIRDSLYGAS